MKRTLLLAGAFSLLLAPASASAATPTFSDIKGHWAEQDILDMASAGIVSGYPDGTFHPNAPVNVDEFVVMTFNNMAQLQPDGSKDWASWWYGKLGPRSISDLRARQNTVGFDWKSNPYYWAMDYVGFGVFMNVIPNTPPYTRPIQRYEAASVISVLLNWTEGQEDSNYANLALPRLSDIKGVKSQFDIQDLFIKGVMTGYPDGTFQPKRSITRAEALSLLKRMKDPALRHPFLPDVSQVPHAEMNTSHGKKMFVFDNWQAYKHYEHLLKASSKTQGVLEQSGTSFAFYDNQELQQADRNNIRIERMQDRSYSLLISNSFDLYQKPVNVISVSLEKNALTKHQDVLNDELEYLFGSEGPAVLKRITSGLNRARSGEEFKELFQANHHEIEMKAYRSKTSGQLVKLDLQISQ